MPAMLSRSSCSSVLALALAVVATLTWTTSPARARAEPWTASAAQAQAEADADLPIFDAHLHYNRDQWSVYSVDEILRLLDRAGVRKAFVSSTPDDGTLMLSDRAPERIVPNLRPYRVAADQFSWTRDPTILDYLQERLAGASYRGLGELHLNPGEAGLSV